MNKCAIKLLICNFVLCFFAACLFGTSSLEAKSSALKKPIVIVIPSYNNERWYNPNLQTVLSQKYSNYRVIYINDCSKDATGKLVEEFLSKKSVDYRVVDFDDSNCTTIEEATDEFVKLINKERHFFTLVNNVNRCGALQNLYRAIHSCDDEEIVATVDGDDWLNGKFVLGYLNRCYKKKDIWLTHGRLKEFPNGHAAWCEPVPKALVIQNKFREFKCPSHLRTFYAWLFKKIDLNDLLYEGEFFPMTWDMAIMYPMIEMAGERHEFINQINYIYNVANDINDNKVNAELQRTLDHYIRSMTPYERL